MEDPTPVAPVPQKRPHESDDTEPSISTPVKQIHSEASSPLSVLSVQTPSPLKSSAPNSNAPDNSNASAPTTSQPAKRRKLTTHEKEAQRLEKEAKAKAREEKKAQKEAEEKVKAEQKAQKDEEKRKKNEERDEKKRLKEEEQQRIEEEKAKKARVSQTSRLNRELNSANSLTVSNEAECFLREAKSGNQPRTGRGSFIPEPHCFICIFNKHIWSRY
jgi:chromatin assembly factor 1 subunit A